MTTTIRIRRLLRRALALRCLVCGKGRIFRGMIRSNAYCPACGYRFERENGYFLGAIYINYAITGGILVGLVLFHFLLVPMPRWLLVSSGVTFGVVMPVWFSRYARALFMALDLYFDQPVENDFAIRDPTAGE